MLLRWNLLVQTPLVQVSFCAVGIMASLSVYSVLQERMMTVPFERHDGSGTDLFTHSLFLVVLNRVVTCAVALAAMLASGEALRPGAPAHKFAAVSLSNVGATACQYEALRYLSFPVQTLAKCAKMLPVMAWGVVVLRKSYGPRDIAVAVAITAGCTAFALAGETSSAVAAGRPPLENGAWGVALMLGYLAMDGFTPTLQESLYTAHRALSINNQLFYVNAVSALVAAVGLAAAGGAGAAVSFAGSHPALLPSAVILSAAATAGQQFIAYTIRARGALTFAVIMTTRQLLSILLSCLVFGHPLRPLQWAGAAAVFAALYAQSLLKASGGGGHGAGGGRRGVGGAEAAPKSAKDGLATVSPEVSLGNGVLTPVEEEPGVARISPFTFGGPAAHAAVV